MKGVCVGWMVIFVIFVIVGDYFVFDVIVGYYNVSCLLVFILENFDGENVGIVNWVDVIFGFSIFIKLISGYGMFVFVGKVFLLVYVGKKVYVVFKYEGDGVNKKIIIYQIDNIMVGIFILVNSFFIFIYVVKVYDGKNWKNKSNSVYVLIYVDYGDMGQSKCYFIFDVLVVNYLFVYLFKMVVYFVDGDVCVVVYRYYNGIDLKIYSDEYIYFVEKVRWELNICIVDKIEQFVLFDGKWNFDLSIVVILKVEKGDVEIVVFYQIIIDWVIVNKG